MAVMTLAALLLVGRLTRPVEGEVNLCGLPPSVASLSLAIMVPLRRHERFGTRAGYQTLARYKCRVRRFRDENKPMNGTFPWREHAIACSVKPYCVGLRWPDHITWQFFES